MDVDESPLSEDARILKAGLRLLCIIEVAGIHSQLARLPRFIPFGIKIWILGTHSISPDSPLSGHAMDVLALVHYVSIIKKPRIDYYHYVNKQVNKSSLVNGPRLAIHELSLMQPIDDFSMTQSLRATMIISNLE